MTFMFGPSGFFQNISDTDSAVSPADLEIIYDSKEGFNILYRVCKNGRFFVYKALKPEYRNNKIYEDLLNKDFNIGFSLTHSGICQYYGMVDAPSLGKCIVMEWVDGCRLRELISSRKIDRRLARKLICELCEALEYVHRKQVIHRDLKPENILVTYNGQNVKIIDFGLSDTDSYNVFKAPAGTKVYAAPELIAGDHIDGRSDIWSLGLIINEISGYYSHVASGCLRRNRERRYRTALDVKKAVLSIERRNFFRAVLGVALMFLVLVGTWWMRNNVLLGAIESPEQIIDAQEVVQPVIPTDTTDTSKVRPDLSRPHDTVQLPQEEIDAAALDDLFKEASEKL